MSLTFTEDELKAFKSEYAKGATTEQFNLFISECQRRELRPGVHLVFQLRNAKEWDPVVGASVFVKKPFWITTIAALLLIAERTGKYDGASAPEYIYLDKDGDPTVISDIPLPDKERVGSPREPWAVRVKIRRKDFSEPITSIVRFDSVAATQKRDNTIVLTDMWQKRPGEQCAKCSLANGIRIGFPEEAGHLFLAEELRNEAEDEKPPAVTPASVVPQPPVVPPVNQVPAEPTTTPRPNEDQSASNVQTPTVEIAKAVETTPQTANPEKAPDSAAKEKVLAAIPELKTAAELPTPTKKPTGRPKKDKPGPVTGQPVDQGITQADIDAPPLPVPTPEEAAAEKKEVEDFVDGIDPTPTKEEQAGFNARVRKLVDQGVVGVDLKNYILARTKVPDTGHLTKRQWEDSLVEIEAIPKEKLKEVIKNAPLPAF